MWCFTWISATWNVNFLFLCPLRKSVASHLGFTSFRHSSLPILLQNERCIDSSLWCINKTFWVPTETDSIETMITRVWFKISTLIVFRERSGIDRVNGHTGMRREGATAGACFNGVWMEGQGHISREMSEREKVLKRLASNTGLWQCKALIPRIVWAFLIWECCFSNFCISSTNF